MGCPELDMTSYFRFVRPDENPCERSQSPTKKTAYGRFSRTVTDDPIGNRLTSASKETGTTVTRNYTANNLNQYTAINNPTAAPTYDFDGNMTSMPLGAANWSLTWDAENRLIAAESPAGATRLEFKYDYMSRRVEKKLYSGSTGNWTLDTHLKFVYDGYLQIEELALDIPNSQFVIRNCRVWSPALQGLGSEKYLSETQGGSTYYALGDANKNITEYLDASGNIKAHYEFSPFGKVVTATGTMSGDFNYRFSSEYLDIESGLVYYILRYYSPELGRWLSRDPIGEKGGNNLYNMIRNNTTNKWDLLGVASWEDCANAILSYPKPNKLNKYRSKCPLQIRCSCKKPTGKGAQCFPGNPTVIELYYCNLYKSELPSELIHELQHYYDSCDDGKEDETDECARKICFEWRAAVAASWAMYFRLY